jgi:hypothetical protein
VSRGAAVSLTIGVLLLAGCGGGHDMSTQGSNTWSVTVANNIGPQTGPSPVTVLRAVVAAYRREGMSPVEAHGCHPSQEDLLWVCRVKIKDCYARVRVAFDGPHDITGEVRGGATECTADRTEVASIMKSCLLDAGPGGLQSCTVKRVRQAVDRGELPEREVVGVIRAGVADVVPKKDGP